MGSYISTTAAQQREMLKEAGYKDFEDMFSCIPAEVKLNRKPAVPAGMSEMEASTQMKSLAARNTVFHHIFRGAGAYDHYIPEIVRQVTAKEEFVTAYTPYQAEISQGVLQSVFEYQTMICELTGMDVSNASVYDGATAAAESIFMCTGPSRKRVLVSGAVNPRVSAVMKTYCHGRSITLETIPCRNGETDIEALSSMIDDSVACVYIQQPNYYGILEDAETAGKIAHKNGALFVTGCNPIALALIQSPAEYGADIVTAEGQPLGMPLSFGGPYLGIMAAKQELMRKLPGRIVGQTVDSDGKRGFVLTLQTREQHIRREKAGSNICTNEALCALTALAYLSAMGPEGLKRAAVLSTSKAHYFQNKLAEAGFTPVYDRPFFNEFVTTCPCSSRTLMNVLAGHGILGGLPLPGGNILWCTTEKNTKADIDETVRLAGGITA
ncbi:MAG: aminomethyl-transferring glycine dehydrogenase subunit GcvPA [Treponema sp.]